MKLQFVGVNNVMDNIYYDSERGLYVIPIEDANPGEQSEALYETLEEAQNSW